MGITDDVSRLKMSLAAAEAKAMMLDLLPTPVMQIARDYAVAYINPACAALLGVNRQHVIGMNSHNVLRTPLCHAGACLCQQSVQASSRTTGETVLDPAGLNLPLQFTSVPLEDGGGNLIGALITFSDLQREHALAEDVQALKTAILKGDFAARMNFGSVEGAAREVFQGVNVMLDAVTAPFGTLSAYIEVLARGDIPERISEDYPGRFSGLSQNLNACSTMLRDVFDETVRTATALSRGKLERRADAIKYKGQWAGMAKGLNDALESLQDPAREIGRVLEKIAAGNFKARVTASYQGDYQTLKSACNEIGSQLQESREALETLRTAVVKGQLGVRAEMRQCKGSFVDLVQSANDIVEALSAPVATMTEYIRQIASGSLPGRIIDEYKGNFNDIKNSLNALIEYLQECIHAADAIATGDLSLEITPRSERDLLSAAFVSVREALRQFITELHNLIGGIIEGRLTARANVASLQGDYTRVVRGVNMMLDAVIGPLNLTTQYVERIASGNIPAKLAEEYDGDFNDIRNHINHCIDTIHTLIGESGAMVEAAAQGNWEQRLDVSQYEGEWATLARGLNMTAEHVHATVQDAASVLNRLAEGNFDARMTNEYKGGDHVLKTACNDLGDQLYGLQQTIARLRFDLANGQLEARADTQPWKLQFGAMVQGVNQMLDTIAAPLQGITEYVAALASGDCPEKLTLPAKGSFNKIQQDLVTLGAVMQDVTQLAEQIAAGNLSMNLPERSNRDKLSRSLNLMQQTLRAVVSETQRQIYAVQEGRLGIRGNVANLNGGWRDVIGGVNRMVDMFMTPLTTMTEYVNRLAGGEIPDKITEEFRGEFNGARNTLNRLIEAMSEVKSLAREIADGNVHLSVQERSEKDDLMRTMKAMVAAVQGIAEAPETQAKRWQIPLPQASDEQDGALGLTLRHMVSNFQQMMEEMEKSMQDIQQQHWIQSGLVELESLLREAANAPTLAKYLTTFLAKYVKAQVGAIYLAVDVKGETMLRLSGSYAYSMRKGNSAEFAVGEGLIGQAALERETIVFSELPEQYMVSSGLGRTPLRCIVVTPFLYADELIGVIELGSTREFPETHLQFLKQACESIAAAFRALQRRERGEETRPALQPPRADLRQHQEHLRTRQEELEVQMRALHESRQKIQHQEEELRSRHEELGSHGLSLRESEQKLQQRQEELRLRHEDIDAQARAVRESEQLIRQQQQQLQARYAELETQSAALRQSHQKRQLREEQLQARYDALQTQAKTLRESEQNLQKQREKLRRHYEELEGRAKILRESEQRIQQQREHLRTRYEEVEARANTLRDFERQLQEQHAKMKEQDDMLAQRVKDLEQQRTELLGKQANLEKTREMVQAQMKELETSHRFNPEFLVNMSYKLRTSLNRLLIISNLLLENKDHNLTAKQLDFVRTINESVSKLLALMNEVLYLSKIESGAVEVHPENLSVRGLANYIEQHFGHPAREKGLVFQVEIAEGMPVMIATARQPVEQVLQHVLSNAVKFTERGSITVRFIRPAMAIPAGQTELQAINSIAIAVTDTGCGIPREKLATIFDAFQPGSQGASRKTAGMGLGLSVARGLARLLGGELVAQSESGSGSTFTISLPEQVNAAAQSALYVPQPKSGVPVQAIPPRAMPHVDVQPTVPGVRDAAEASAAQTPKSLATWVDTLPFLSLPDSEESEEPISEIAAPAAAVNEQKVMRTFLMLGGERTLQEKISAALQSCGGTLTVVRTAPEAYRQVQTTSFDGMILHLKKADRMGQEFLDMLEEDAMLAPIAILVSTEQPLHPAEEQQLRQHAKARLIAVAVSPEQLLAELTKHLPQPEPELVELQDEVTKELQQVEDLLIEQQNELRLFRSKDAVLNRRSILVVGRDRGNVYTLTNVLQEKGAQVLFAENAPEVMQQLESHPGTDLVLMENVLPEMDGCKVTRDIRRQSRFAKLPIIALLVNAKMDEYQRCLDAGANDYLLKPVDTDELLSLLRVWLY